nr:MAG TPA: hypothetical protein [Caudoviricetes sp.]
MIRLLAIEHMFACGLRAVIVFKTFICSIDNYM